MIDPSDQNHQTNVFRVKESSHPLLQKRALFALGKRRDAPDGAVYTIYLVKEVDKGSYKVENRVGSYSVPKTFDEKYGDLTVKDVDTEAFADIGDAAIQAAETVEVPEKGNKGVVPNLDVVQIPGRGDCFFQSVAYCILADDKFLDEVDFEPWISEDDLKATSQERKQKNLMSTSDAWIARLRERVSDGATVAMYLHGHEMALQSLDRKLYVKLMHAAESPQKKSDTAGDVYKEGSKWYYSHGPGKPSEQLDSRPYPPIWNESQSEKEWIAEQAADLKLKSADADGAGEITAQKQFLERCTSFKRFKSFIKTADYWADERAVEVLADRLQINILIVDVGYGANSVTGVHSERSKTVILQRTGQHYNAMFKTGTSKYVFDTTGKIVSKLNVDLKKKKGGGEVVTDDEEDEDDADAQNVVKTGGGDDIDSKSDDGGEEGMTDKTVVEIESGDNSNNMQAETKTNTENAMSEIAENIDSGEKEEGEDVSPAANVVEPASGGSFKRSRKNKSKSSNTSRRKKIVIHTEDVSF